ncbi:MerR family transcriptional regulator [Amycolatopsis sp. NPDC059027]|uniref:helix-turn-helix domain-containing protein n=1 Tax=Amycolatopsis sp. NPDC059027 TaxID=3346709 RepID=UPI00366C42C9
MLSDEGVKSGVRIREAAALYDLAPSTLRWWEAQGVLDAPEREAGKRLYSDCDLRRIGLAYLCRVAGRMPLEQAAVVTAGTANVEAWHGVVGAQVARLEREIGFLVAARDYLAHLMLCSDDDPALCPHLDGELVARTPRGRVAGGDLLEAAQAAARHEERDEARSGGVENPEDVPLCPGCGEQVDSPSRGRPRTYCSHACRQRAYRARRGRPGR